MEVERLQKKIASYGFTSRRKAEELIVDGRVKVNGKKITELGYKVLDKDVIEVDDVIIEKDNKVYYLLYKPRGVISSSNDDKDRKTVVDLINTNVRIYPIGRLDYDTTGIILLTNDGDFANLMMHPSNEIEKLYIAKIEGKLSGYEIKKLKEGIFIDGYKTSPCKVKIKNYDKKSDTSIIEIVIHEGKNHQIKKMFEQVSHEVIKLKREKIAFLTLNGLNSGEYRSLTPKEIKKLYSLALHEEN